MKYLTHILTKLLVLRDGSRNAYFSHLTVFYGLCPGR